jgi:hypothetical protein
MPQVDLRPLFDPPRTGYARPEPFPDENPKELKPWRSTIPRSRVRMTLAQLTNIGFVLVACLGALISAAYLFKGGELIQEVAAWPRELFYGRPTPVPKPSPPHDSKRSATFSTVRTVAVADESGDPFSSARKLLSLSPSPNSNLSPNGRSSGTPFSTSQLTLNSLNAPAPGGDSLSRALTQAAPSLAQPSSSTAKSAITTAQTTGSKIEHRGSAGVKNATAQVKTSAKDLTAAKIQSPSPKTGNGRATLESKAKIQPQISHGTGGLSKASAPSAGAQSGGTLKSIAPGDHSFGGAGGTGTEMTGAHSLGRMGGR